MTRTPGIAAIDDPAGHARMALEVAGALHAGIAHLTDADEAAAAWRIGEQPGVAWFQRDGGDTISHRSLSLPEDAVAVIEHLAERHRELHGIQSGSNAHVLPLVLAALYLADATTLDALDIASLVRRPATVRVIDEESARHDPELAPYDGALRVWVPVVDERYQSTVMTWPAVLEVAFESGRRTRYVPWEGAGLPGDVSTDQRN